MIGRGRLQPWGSCLEGEPQVRMSYFNALKSNDLNIYLESSSEVVSCLSLMKTDCRARVVRVASSSNGLVDSGNERSSD